MSALSFTTLLQNSLFVVGASATVIALVLLGVLVRQIRRNSVEPRARATQADLAHMMILLQTMRDILEEQKKVARHINEQIDKKMSQINQMIDGALEKARHLHEMIDHAAETSATAPALRRDASSSAISETPPHSEIQATGTRVERNTAKPAAAKAEPVEKSELHIVAKPTVATASESLLDNWVGIELEEDEPEIDGVYIQDQPPEKPEDAEKARQAFRTLLNLTQDKEHPSSVTPPKTGNGRRRTSPLQARVYEYRDAGMTIAQIAKELGIGKGEVRLILSLRKNKG